MSSDKELSGLERREQMIRLIRERGELTVKEMAEKFGVSDMTVRRDFHTMEHQGIVSLYYGGARMRETHPTYPDFTMRKDKNYEGKRAIALKAATLVRENDIIYLDASTSVNLMLSFIPAVRLTVVTNSLTILETCAGMRNIELYIAPGCFHEQYGGPLDHSTVEYLSRFHFDKAFFGTAAIDARCGVSGTQEIEFAIKRHVWQNSSETYLLFDHTKYGKIQMIRYNEVRDYTLLLTDSQLDSEARSAIKQQGGNLHICY